MFECEASKLGSSLTRLLTGVCWGHLSLDFSLVLLGSSLTRLLAGVCWGRLSPDFSLTFVYMYVCHVWIISVTPAVTVWGMYIYVSVQQITCTGCVGTYRVRRGQRERSTDSTNSREKKLLQSIKLSTGGITHCSYTM